MHRWQLEAAGLSRHQISWRLSRQLLTGVCRGIYAAGDRVPEGPLVIETAAAMRFPGYGVLSHLTAARMWGITDLVPTAVDLTLIGTKHRCAPAGVTVHRTKSIHPREMRRCQGLPVVSPERAFLDMAANCDRLELEAALARGIKRHVISASRLAEAIARAPANRSGLVLARSVFADRANARDTRSLYERKVLRLLDEAGLPRPLTNVFVGDHEVDFYWPEEGLVAEFDSRMFHDDIEAIHRDSERDLDVIASGRQVLRITSRSVDHKPLKLIARVSASLANARAAARSARAARAARAA